MDFEKLNDYLERSFEYKAIKEIGAELPVVYLDENATRTSMWFLDLGPIHRKVCESVPYLYDVDLVTNRLMRRKRISFVPFEDKGVARDYHTPLVGNIYSKGYIGCNFGYTETVKDVPAHGHIMGHLYEHVLLGRKPRDAKSHSDEMILKNVLPITMEKLMLEEFGNEALSEYYKKLRAARFKKMCMVDDLVRNADCAITHEMLVDSLDYDVSITYTDVLDYCAEIEYGNDPVYKSYCYYVADMLATRMVERGTFKKDIQALLKAKSVEDLDVVLNPENVKR